MGVFHKPSQSSPKPPELPKVAMGPNDLWAALHWLGLHGPIGMVELGEVLRAMVDLPLETLELAEEFGLLELRGSVAQLTLAGHGWVEHPQQLPQNLQMLWDRFPWNRVFSRVQQNPVSLVEPLGFFRGPLAVQAALAMAEWGKLFGLWQGRLYPVIREVS